VWECETEDEAALAKKIVRTLDGERRGADVHTRGGR
jgi:hypothetical protein